MTHSETKELINRLFEEEALAIGGLAAIHELDDVLVRRLFETMGVIRRRALRHLVQKTRPGEPTMITPHPAVEEFLASLRGE